MFLSRGIHGIRNGGTAQDFAAGGKSLTAHEFNFDGIVGPTHNYSGLSYGNVASERHKAKVANPRAAALQGLDKMRLVAGLGIKQAVLPPHERPHIPTLRRLGFSGSDREVLAAVAKTSSWLLACVCSASAMWTANAATVSPSADTADSRVHFTPANLANKFHRSIEADVTASVLKAIFPEGRFFAHHPALPCHESFGDEGAANHTRLCVDPASPGVELFVYGRASGDPARVKPKLFPARQTIEASQAIARAHALKPDAVVFARQNPSAIDAGVFHNDVTAVGNGNVLFYHEQAFADTHGTITLLKKVVRKTTSGDLVAIAVKAKDVSLKDAVRSYLFNTQLLSLTGGGMVLIAPEECREIRPVRRYLEKLVTHSDYPTLDVRHVDVRQSMHNGGGPACLRLRVALTEEETGAANPGVVFTDALYDQLKAWIGKHYRDRLAPKDLADPALIDETRSALDKLSALLNLGSVYDFQRELTMA